MSNVMFSEMIIDDLELEFNSKTKFQRHQTKQRKCNPIWFSFSKLSIRA